MESKLDTKKKRNTNFRKDLTGQTFNYLTALYWIRGQGWMCRCKCGNLTVVKPTSLTQGLIKSCGCKNYETKNQKNMLGYEDDYIKVIGQEEKIKGSYPRWICECKTCHRKFFAHGSLVRNYDIRSCGCIHSKGEQEIINLLESNKISYAKEYTFKDLIGTGGKPLRFDFAIFDSNNQLKKLVEYNGDQHYHKPKGSWANEFERTQKHDELKKEYCLKNNIELKVIRYDEKINLDDLI